MIFQIRPLTPPQRPGSAPSPEKGERGGAPRFLGGARVACLEAPAPWRVTLPVDAAAVPPGPISDPSHPPPPLSVSEVGAPGRTSGGGPGGGARGCGPGQRSADRVWLGAAAAAAAAAQGPRRPRERDPSGSHSPGARSGEGTGRVEQGLCEQHSSQHLCTAAWSESRRCGFVAAACCSVDSSLTCLPSLPAARRLEHRVSEVSEKAWKGLGSQVIRDSNAGTGPVNGGKAAGRRPPAGVWEGPHTCKLWL